MCSDLLDKYLSGHNLDNAHNLPKRHPLCQEAYAFNIGINNAYSCVCFAYSTLLGRVKRLVQTTKLIQRTYML